MTALCASFAGFGIGFFGELLHPDYTGTLAEELYNKRMILQEAMVNNGLGPPA